MFIKLSASVKTTWLQHDDDLLIDLVNSGMSRKRIAYTMNRTENAVRGRMRKLMIESKFRKPKRKPIVIKDELKSNHVYEALCAAYQSLNLYSGTYNKQGKYVNS